MRVAYLVAALALLITGCASYTPIIITAESVDATEDSVEKNGAIIRIEQYIEKAKSEVAFDTDLRRKGVLAIYISVENAADNSIDVASLQLVDKDEQQLPQLSWEEAAEKAKRSRAGRAFGLSMIVPIITIPVVAVQSVKHTNKVNDRLRNDFEAKTLPEGEIFPGDQASGFVFFAFDKWKSRLPDLELSLQIENTTTGAMSLLTVGIDTTDFSGP